MLDDTTKLDLTRQDIELIEQALHTQEKILSVQSRAGGAGARTRLKDLKGLIRRLDRQTAVTTPANTAPIWSQVARSILC